MATSLPLTNGHATTNGVNGQDHSSDHGLANLSLSSKTIHADDYLNKGTDVAPPLHVSTTFRYNRDADTLKTWNELDLSAPFDGHIYSRYTAPNTTRLESILSEILHGPTLTYSSGLSAFHAILIFLNPKRIAIGEGYHGCHGVIGIQAKLTGLKKLDLDCPAEELQPGDIVHVETPLNPTGEARDLKAYAEKAHARGAYLTVDATFGPPPLQDPFLWGADLVMHSGTKYVGGHSDMLCGIVAISPAREKEGWFSQMRNERQYMGNVMGSMEGWLGVRSVRTLEIRVQRQSYNATKLVEWLDSELHSEKESSPVKDTLETILHASLQKEGIKAGWLLKQMPNGFGPVFSIIMKEQNFARRLPSKLGLFHHATSLGGVESLIEWRAMTDATVNTRLLRISVGIEGWEDLKEDLLQGFKSLAAEAKIESKH